MNKELVTDLKQFEDWFREADENFDKKRDQYYIVSNISREPVYPQSLAIWLKDFEERNGIKRVSIHGLRHTYCSLLLSQNVPIQTVAKYMRHSDSTITLKVYSHFIPDTQEQVLSVLDNI